MILDVHLQRFLHPIKSGLGLCIHRQAWGSLVYSLGGLRYFGHYPDLSKNKTDVSIKEKS